MPTSRQRYWSTMIVLLLSTALTGCEQLLDYAIDCIDNDKPELSPATLPNPILNQEYFENIHVGIRNEPFDDNFAYAFTVSGNFPAGLQTESVGRDLRVFGTPIELGDFQFDVKVQVGEGSRGLSNVEGLCSTIDTQSYEWEIQPL